MMKIKALNKLARQFDDAQKALTDLDGELGAVSFNPSDPASIEATIGRLGREKVCALKRDKAEMLSDFAGRVWEEMDSDNGWKTALGRELRAAG